MGIPADKITDFQRISGRQSCRSPLCGREGCARCGRMCWVGHRARKCVLTKGSLDRPAEHFVALLPTRWSAVVLFPPNLGGNVTKFAEPKELKLIA